MGTIKKASIMEMLLWEDIVAVVPNVPIEQDRCWWLYNGCARYFVEKDGTVKLWNINNASTPIGIRPHLIIPSDEYTGVKLFPGLKTFVGNTKCTIFKEDSEGVHVLPDKVISLSDTGGSLDELPEYIASDEFKNRIIRGKI